MATEYADAVMLRTRVHRGLAWKLTSQVVVQGSRFVVVLVVARFLTPHEYGLAGMALVFSTLAFVFGDLALGSSLIQRSEIDEHDCSTVFWVTTAVGAVLTAAAFALAAPIAGFYGEPPVQPLFEALSVSFVLAALGSTHGALMTRAMNFRGLELRAIGSTLVGATVGVGAAVGGLGAWSIILMQLATTATSTVMLWCFSGWHPRIAFSLQSLRDLGGFGANVFGTRLLFYLNHNVDNLLVGRVLGAAPLGVYSLAYNGVLAPLNRVAIPVQHVLYPAFARLRHDPPRMRSAWLRSTRLLVAVVAPLCLGLVVVAPDFVTVFFGERWTDATPVIQILAWVALLQAVSTFASGVLQALDRTQALLRFAIVSFAVYLVAFLVGLLWGIVGVAACYAVAATFAVQPLYLRLVTRALGLSMHDLCRSLSGVAQVCAALLVVEVVLRQALVQSGVPPALRLAVVVGLAIVLFLPLCSWRAHAVVEEMRILRPRLRSGRSQTSFRAGEAL